MGKTTDKQGHYEWALPPGRYKVEVFAENYAPQSKEVKVRPDQLVQLDFQLIPD